MNLEFIPLKPKNVMADWKYFREGFERILAHSDGTDLVTNIYNDLLDGSLKLWVGFVDGRYAGFFTARVDPVPFGPVVFQVVHGYSDGTSGRWLLDEVFRRIEAIARQFGCSRIRFRTLREGGFMKKLAGKGYKKTFVEFSKVLEVEG